MSSSRSEPSLFGAIENPSTGDLIAQRIERLILEHQLNPGDALPAERDLAAQLTVGRNAVREALRTLSEKGLVRVVHGRGAFVQEPSAEGIEASLTMLLRFRQVSLSELADARALLEPEMAALAARRATETDHEAIKQLLAALRETAEDSAAHVRADLAFHRGISNAARHTAYQAIIEAVRGPVVQSMVLGTRVPRAIDTSDAQHQAIVDAIVVGDEDAARAGMKAHLAYVSEYVRRQEEEEDVG